MKITYTTPTTNIYIYSTFLNKCYKVLQNQQLETSRYNRGKYNAIVGQITNQSK